LSAAAKSYQVRLQVYDLQGRLVATLKEGVLDSGTHELHWNGSDQSGRKMPAGVYIYKLEAASENGPQVFTQKMIVQ
jgi:flagellar hook assembly protein FlgD